MLAAPAGFAAAARERVDDDRDQKDGAGDHVLGIRLQVEEQDSRCDRADDQHAEHG